MELECAVLFKGFAKYSLQIFLFDIRKIEAWIRYSIIREFTYIAYLILDVSYSDDLLAEKAIGGINIRNPVVEDW